MCVLRQEAPVAVEERVDRGAIGAGGSRPHGGARERRGLAAPAGAGTSRPATRTGTGGGSAGRRSARMERQSRDAAPPHRDRLGGVPLAPRQRRDVLDAGAHPRDAGRPDEHAVVVAAQRGCLHRGGERVDLAAGRVGAQP